MIIGCDIDGILACFESGFKKKLTQVRTGVLPENFNWRSIDTWDWDIKAGYTREEANQAWELAKADSAFWIGLEAYDDTRRFLRDLASVTADDDVYFITHRFGLRAKQQTETWLRMNGWDKHPTVLMAEDKAAVCRALGVNFYIDDKASTMDKVRDGAPRTRGFLLKRGWNASVTGVPTIHCLREFLNVIRLTKGLPELAIAVAE